MKRIISLMVAMLLIAALCVPVFAAPGNPKATTSDDGKIIIDNAAVGETYAVYQMAILESYSGTGAYSYWVDESWRGFFETDSAKKYFHVSEDGYLSTTSNQMQAANKEKMVEDALAWIEEKGIEADQRTNAESGSVVFENLTLGYYLVDSSLGTLCNLSTTEPEVTISDKNSGPTIQKDVKEDRDDAWHDHNDADMFEPVEFREILSCKKGARNYVVHDTMSGLQFIESSLKIYSGSPASDDSNLVNASNYTLETNVNHDEGTCTFHITFNQDFCDKMTNDTKLHIMYKAFLTEDAVIGDGTGNKNEVYLSYGNSQKTTSDITYTSTFEFELVKTDESGKYLGGAEFTLWDAKTDGNKIEVVKEDDGTYRIAKANETGVNIVLSDGKAVKISGLDGATTYYLQEEIAPSGYNKLSSRQSFEISDKNLNITPDDDESKYSGREGGIRVINKTGAVLPETGGMGTTMFILIGGLLVLCSGVLLATKLRMSKLRG